MNQQTFQIRVDRSSSVPVIHISGTIDESADLSPLHELDEPSVIFDLSGVRRINSFGVRSWMEAMRVIPERIALTFVGCSPPVVDQFNMVIGFVGHAHIESFQAPLICEECDEQKWVRFDSAQCLELGGSLPPTPCPNCGERMEMDDLEEQYLHFLQVQSERR